MNETESTALPTHRRVHTDKSDFSYFLKRNNDLELEQASLFSTSGFKTTREKMLEIHLSNKQRRKEEFEQSETQVRKR